MEIEVLVVVKWRVGGRCGVGGEGGERGRG